MVKPLISELFYWLTKENSYLVKLNAISLCLLCRFIKWHENNCKDILVSMLLILTCSISGKAVDFAKVCVKSGRNLQRFCYIVFMFFSPHPKKINRKAQNLQIPDSHGQQMLSWALSLLLKFILPTSSVYAGWLKITFSSETYSWYCPTMKICLYMVGPNNTFQIKTRIMQLRAVIIISTRFGGFWFSR